MKGHRLGWLLGLASLATLLFGHGPDKPPPAAQVAAMPAERGKPLAPGEEGALRDNGWAAYLRLYEDFFGLPFRGLETDAAIRAIAAAAASMPNRPGYELKFLVALVPDPADARLADNFDLDVEGILMGLGQSQAQYLLDRRWLPAADPPRAETERTASHGPAGVMLFRDGRPAATPGPRRLMTVFLVGETPIAGINKDAFRQAVSFISKLTQAVNCQQPQTANPRPTPVGGKSDPILVLGPPSSGSAESLGLAMESLSESRFTVVSGSATVPNLERFFPASATFARTIVPDDALADRALAFLEKDLGWDLRFAALLIEGGSAYADWFKHAGGRMRLMPKILLPSGLQSIRNLWEKSRSEARSGSPAGDTRLSFPGGSASRPEVSLADQATPLDWPEVSPLTAQIEDVALDNLLRRVSRYGYRYIGIVATDVKDEIFLAQRIRRLAPNAIVFALQSNLLYANPRTPTSPMFGALAILSFPLVTRGSRPPSSGGERELVQVPTRQFSSEGQEGVFLATQCLLGESIVLPPVWIAAVGNNSAAPLARLSVDPSVFAPQYLPCAWHRLAPTMVAPEQGDRLLLLGDLPVLFFLIFLCAIGYLLVRPPFLDGPGAKPDPLLAVAAAVLTTMAAGVLVLVRLPSLEPAYFAQHLLRGALETILPWITVMVVVYLVSILAICMGLVAGAVRWPQRVLALLAATASLSCLCPGALRWLIRIWSSDPGLFYLRARSFSNGFSPFLSLAWLGGAFLAWLLIELRRHQIQVRHGVARPATGDEPALSSCKDDLDAIEGLCTSVLPRRWGLFALMGVVLLSTIAPFWNSTQPIGESQWYGRVIFDLLVAAFLLSLTSFYRFVTCWHLLRHFLGRLEHCACSRCFEKVSSLVHWNPMWSFAWHSPTYKGVVQPIELLERLGKWSELSWLQDNLLHLRRLLGEVFASEAKRQVAKEGEARRELAAELQIVMRELALRGHTRQAEELGALLIVTYLRQVFAHLRYALMGTMLPALLLLAAVQSYAFAPRHYLLLLYWGAVVAASIISIAIFVQMDRDAVLSRISGTRPGKVTLNRAFLSNVFAYAVIPLAGLISSQIPELGDLVARWLEPIGRILETT